MSNVSKDIQPAKATASSTNHSNQLTEDQFKRVLPKKLQGSVRPEVMNKINTVITDPFIQENYRDNLLSYTSVMKDGKFRLDQYIDAVRYVSFKLLGSSNIEAYVKTFPDRYQNFLDSGTTDRDIASYVSSYNKNKLVNLILEQTLVPSAVLNADLYQKALNTQAVLMQDAKSEKVRSDAANSILTHLKMPENQKLEIDVNIKEDSAISELRATTQALVDQQREMIQKKQISAKEAAHSRLVAVDGDTIVD